MKRIITLVFIILYSQSIKSTDTTIVKFMPLALGNIWVYNWTEYIYPGEISGISKFKIINTVMINGKLYYCFRTSITNPVGLGCGTGLLDTLRIDSLTGNLYQFNRYTNSECIFDSLNAKIHDTCRNVCSYGGFIILTDTTSGNIFGIIKPSKMYLMLAGETSNQRKYFKGIGLSGWSSGLNQGSCTYTLKGCVINGIVYGDTSFPVGIIQISKEIPKSFSLSQNYPNPFNPSTKIKFSIEAAPLSVENGEGLGVRIIIYDILGREVATLVNEKLQAGTYEIEWDASNYPSGVYLCKLTATGFTETKRMILLK